jgi:RHS repeat-associated protein
MIARSPTKARTAYTWDANGNRVTGVETGDGALDLTGSTSGAQQSSQTRQTSRLDAGSNRLLGFDQTLILTQGGRTLASSSAGVAYTLDAAGNLTRDGLRQYDIDGSGRIAAVRVSREVDAQDAAQVRYLHDALGQRVFKSEVTGSGEPPSEQALGSDFVSWLQRHFGWLFAGGSASSTQLGQAFIYDENANLLAEMGNGGSQGPGSADIVWLPGEGGMGGQAIPIGLHKGGKLYAIHPDHLGTPRRIVDDAGKVAWQWPYSAMGQVQPTGVLKVTGGQGQGNTPNANANPNAQQATQERLERTEPATTFNLRFPGQYFDTESGLHYNYVRSYMPGQGRYTQGDPIGLAGGWNRFLYVEGNPIIYTDPNGLNPVAGALNGGRLGATAGSAFGPVGTVVGGLLGAGAGAAIGWLVTGPSRLLKYHPRKRVCPLPMASGLRLTFAS